MHTWAEQSADRVAVSKTLIDRLYLGGTPGFRNKLWPTHTVSWEDLSDEFAAWVLKTTPRELRLWVFNFESRPQAGKLRVWGLEGGAYEMRFGPDADRDEKADGAEAPARLDLERCSDIPLTLPSRRLMALALRQVKAGPPLFPRPDLAVVATDMAFDPAKGVLRFVVHNVGSAAAKNVKVAVEADGRPLAAHDILELKSPDDLRPQTLAFEQQVAAGARKVVVVVDPENRVSELWKGNNRAVWERPTPDAGH
jgi:hypothetical protein